MKVLKKIVAIGAMACMCVAFGGTKVAEAAACTHKNVKEVGKYLYSETVGSHEVYDYTDEWVINSEGVLVLQRTYYLDKVYTCLSTMHYSDVAQVCKSCGAVIDTWEELAWYMHTHRKCEYYSNEPIRFK